MEKATPEQTHALLEKLAEYVMTEIPAIKEKLDKKVDKADMQQKADKSDLQQLATKADLQQKADKSDLQQKADKADLLRLAEKTDVLQKDVERIDNKVDMIIEVLDAQTQQLDIIRTDMKAIGGTLDLHERRLSDLEQRTFGYRVRDKDDAQ